MPRLALPLPLLLLLAGPIRAADVDESGLRAALGRTLLVPGQTLAEAQWFVDARIPDVPAVRSADEWRATAARLRADTLRKVVFRGQAVAWRDATTRVEFLQTIDGGPGYHIRKLRFEALPGLWIPALLYEPDRLDGKVPVVLNVNGHDAKGKAVDYKQLRCINQAKRGMIALNLEWFGMGQLKTPGFGHGLINAIDLCGTSGIATHFLAMKRGIDILLSHEHADPRPSGRDGAVRRRLADHLHQPARPARHVHQPGGRLFQLPYAGAAMRRTSATPSRRRATWPRWSTTPT